MRVIVAVVGDPTRPFGRTVDLNPGGDIDVPYGELPKVELDVNENETLGSVLSRACHEVGYEVPWEAPVIQGIGFIDFHRDGHRPLLRHEVTLVDRDGHVEWIHRWKDVRYGDLQRAGEAGVLAGDPRRPYLFLQPEIGNGVLVTLAAIYGGWKIFWEVVDNLEKLGKLTKGLKRLFTSRAPEAGEAIGSHYREWQKNGARPDTLRQFLGDHEWSLDHLAEVLGCRPEEAEALLLGLGHERGDDGLWRPGESEEAQFLRGTYQILMVGGTWAPADLEQVLRERTEEFLKSGKAPEIDWMKLREVPEDQERVTALNDEWREIVEERERQDPPDG